MCGAEEEDLDDDEFEYLLFSQQSGKTLSLWHVIIDFRFLCENKFIDYLRCIEEMDYRFGSRHNKCILQLFCYFRKIWP